MGWGIRSDSTLGVMLCLPWLLYETNQGTVNLLLPKRINPPAFRGCRIMHILYLSEPRKTDPFSSSPYLPAKEPSLLLLRRKWTGLDTLLRGRTTMDECSIGLEGMIEDNLTCLSQYLRV